MKTNLLRRTLRVLLLNLTLMVLAAGCATHDEHSYNQDFHQTLPTSPSYYIENVNENQFKVRVRQGTALTGTDRILYVKQAATAVAASEAKRRGWSNWELNYIQDRDQGWMHVVIAEVTRKNPAEKTSDSTR